MSLGYILPEGFRWIVKSRDDLEFEHVVSEKALLYFRYPEGGAR